jgi:hypothetical protein
LGYYLHGIHTSERYLVKFSLKSAVALIAASAFPVIAVAPASAAPLDFSAVTIDCMEDLVYGEMFEPVVDHALYNTDSVVITLENCTDFYMQDLANTSNASQGPSPLVGGGTYQNVLGNPATVNVTGPVTITFTDTETDVIGEVVVYEPSTLPDPDDGVFLAEGSQDIGAGATDFTAVGDPESYVELGGVGSCGMVSGDHVYASQKFIVTTGGTFTFRVTSTDPQSNWAHHRTPYHPMEDTFLMIAREFNESDAGSSVVGCDDDLSGETINGTEYSDRVHVTDDGQLYQRNQPYMIADLEPGNYTLVFTFWQNVSASDWASGTGDFDSWTPGTATFNFDVWGPVGGAQLVEAFAPLAPLANTGVDPAFALWTGLALAGTGVAITVARRRAQRA